MSLKVAAGPRCLRSPPCERPGAPTITPSDTVGLTTPIRDFAFALSYLLSGLQRGGASDAGAIMGMVD